jgi:hypothetical protein
MIRRHSSLPCVIAVIVFALMLTGMVTLIPCVLGCPVPGRVLFPICGCK